MGRMLQWSLVLDMPVPDDLAYRADVTDINFSLPQPSNREECGIWRRAAAVSREN